MHMLPPRGIVAWGIAGVLALTLSGCLLTPTPVIPPGSGEDVGEVLEFRHYDAPDDSEPEIIERYERGQANVYSGEIGNLARFERVDIRRFGTRQSDRVFFIQANANQARFQMSDDAYLAKEGFLYLNYLIALRPDGVGAMALVNCADPDLPVKAAEAFGLVLTCDLDSGYVARIATDSGGDAVLAFLRNALETGTLLWEDQAKVNLLGTYED